MTDSKTELDDLRAQLGRVNAKNRELLAENGQLKDRNREQTEQITALAACKRRYEVDGPAGQLLDEIAMPGTGDAWRLQFEQYYRLDAGEDGQLVIRDTKGEPVMLPAIPGTKGREVEREARATTRDILALVDTPELRGKFAAITVGSRASGGGAGGSGRPGAAVRSAKPVQETRLDPKLGLR